MDDPNEGLFVLTFNKEAKTLHRYVFNLTPTEQQVLLQKVAPVVFNEVLAFEREMALQEASTEEKPKA